MVPIARDAVLVAEERRELSCAVVHGLLEHARIADEALVLDAYGSLVIAPIPCVPGDVFLQNRLPYDPIRRADDVVGRSLCPGILEPVYGARPGTLDDVDNYLV